MQLFILCLKIFFVRILDVSLGTIYTITIVKGKKWLGALIGFIEILIWFMIVREALNFQADNFIQSLLIGVSYALGFATGTILGGYLTDKYVHGLVTTQIITTKADILAPYFRDKGYAVSIINVEGLKKEIQQKMLLMEISDTKLNELKDILKKLDPKSFLIVTETKYINNGYGFIK